MTENEKIIEEANEIAKGRMYATNEVIRLQKELEQYREMEQRLQNIYGECDVLLESVVEYLIEYTQQNVPNKISKALLLTDEDVDKWEQLKSIGTIEEFKALKEKSVAKKPIRSDLCTCPSCGTHNEIIKKRRNTVTFDTVYCWHCGQAIEIKRDLLERINYLEHDKEGKEPNQRA